jgi:hypothetical protein
MRLDAKICVRCHGVVMLDDNLRISKFVSFKLPMRV